MKHGNELRKSCGELPSIPGVYRMLDQEDTVIYVGKARDLKRRVSSYFFRTTGHSPKVSAMLKVVCRFEITTTANESEALILESNLIKELRPRYNIVLRDDKSYPYIYAEADRSYPRLRFHRGARKEKGRYFGPYPNAGAVRQTLNLLQKMFKIRQCEDSFFGNRSRPCLQYQIDRCSAPCVKLIDETDYGKDMQMAVMFLEGKNKEVRSYLVNDMEKAAGNLDYERAAQIRDQISSLSAVQNEQNMDGAQGSFDVMAAAIRNGVGCVQIFFVRHGRMLGDKAFFPSNTKEATAPEMLNEFVSQFYFSGHRDREVPSHIIVTEYLEDQKWLEESLSNASGKKVTISKNVRGERAKWQRMASDNVKLTLEQRLAATSGQVERMKSLSKALGMDSMIDRIECFDISHTQGEATVASCVVFDQNGPRKSDYRKFKIRDAKEGDDYAAMREAIERRYSRLKKDEDNFPDVLLIDGGKGQLGKVKEVFEELQIEGVKLLGIAKGVTRKPGLETIFLGESGKVISLQSASQALRHLQYIRDEAHRFAIDTHRRSRAKTRNRSSLEGISGVGAKRRKLLIQHFGGIKGVGAASVDDLAGVPGISQSLAKRIHDVMHD